MKQIDFTQKNSKILKDLHKLIRYTIRKLTFQMANIDNYPIFKRHKELNYDNILTLVYKSERLF
jgi:hypothetical protein